MTPAQLAILQFNFQVSELQLKPSICLVTAVTFACYQGVLVFSCLLCCSAMLHLERSSVMHRLIHTNGCTRRPYLDGSLLKSIWVLCLAAADIVVSWIACCSDGCPTLSNMCSADTFASHNFARDHPHPLCYSQRAPQRYACLQ